MHNPIFHQLSKCTVFGCALIFGSASYAQTCTLSSAPVTFANYDPFSSVASDISGSLTVTCNSAVSLLVSYTMQLSAGLSGSMSPRKMSNGGTQLSYQLYSNSGRTTIWGDGSAGTSTVTDGYLISVLVPVVRNYSVYGRITAKQNVTAGSYLDTVTVLMTY